MPKQVQLSDAAYAALTALKRPDESFSDLALRLAWERKDPTALLRLPPLDPTFDYGRAREESRRVDIERLRKRGLVK